MISRSPTLVDWIFVVVACAAGLMFLYEAWQNLVGRRFSRLGPYGIVAWLGLRLGDSKMRDRIQHASSDRKRMLWAGLYALFLGIGGVAFVARWLRLFVLK